MQKRLFDNLTVKQNALIVAGSIEAGAILVIGALLFSSCSMGTMAVLCFSLLIIEILVWLFIAIYLDIVKTTK